MKYRAPLFFLLIVSSVLLQACGAGAEAAIATGIAQTQQISALETAAADGGAEEAPAEGGEAGTPAPSVAFVSVSQNTNCRSGPRLDYTLLTAINVGQQVEVLKTFSNDYAVVKNPNSSGDCWLFLQFANTTDFSAFNLAVATQPPTPQPTNTPKPAFDWNGTWLMSSATFGSSSIGRTNFNVVVSQSGDSISGSFVAFDGTITFFASLSQNGQVATGTWEDGHSSGALQWQIKTTNMNQFIGHNEGYGGASDEWCGARAGASLPSPCYGP